MNHSATNVPTAVPGEERGKKRGITALKAAKKGIAPVGINDQN